MSGVEFICDDCYQRGKALLIKERGEARIEQFCLGLGDPDETPCAICRTPVGRPYHEPCNMEPFRRAFAMARAR